MTSTHPSLNRMLSVCYLLPFDASTDFLCFFLPFLPSFVSFELGPIVSMIEPIVYDRVTSAIANLIVSDQVDSSSRRPLKATIHVSAI